MSPAPAGRQQIQTALAALGLEAGRDVLVHCSMRAIGPIDGGPATLVEAIRGVIGSAGTLVVPAQTPDNSTTSPVFHRAVRGMDDRARSAYIHAMPGFDRATTPSYGMGAFAEHVRRDAASARSAHPQTSFAALGRRAGELMAVHDLDCHLGERSPLGALYERDALVLLLGVGYWACTAFHLAEYRRRHRTVRDYECFTVENGQRRQWNFRALHLDDSDFDKIGNAFEQEHAVAAGLMGTGQTRALSIRLAVDFAVGWMDAHRSS
jgi:aminoglycoside 3-N-acetyltransferase